VTPSSPRSNGTRRNDEHHDHDDDVEASAEREDRIPWPTRTFVPRYVEVLLSSMDGLITLYEWVMNEDGDPRYLERIGRARRALEAIR